MTVSPGTWRRPGKGRPRNDDRGEILVHFARGRELGFSITEIASRGLEIWGWDLATDGHTRKLCVLRRYAGPTLERRYREFLREVELSVEHVVSANVVLDGVKIGPGRFQRPLSFPSPKAVRRGRPSKKRAR